METMTRQEVEQKIFEHLKSIVALAKEYSPKDDYITLHYKAGCYGFNNTHWESYSNPIDFWVCEDDAETN